MTFPRITWKKKSNLTLNIFTLKTDKKTYFDMESIVYPYENILEGPGNYLSLSMNDYTDVLIKIKWNFYFHTSFWCLQRSVKIKI